jgi:type I restriction enzyme M protein
MRWPCLPTGPSLCAGSVCARIKEDLLKNYCLHTIVRLPLGVFAPYADIQTNILFFDRGAPAKKVWFYEVPIAEEHREKKNPKYSKTKPMRFEEFADCIKWFHPVGKRKETDYAWKVPVTDILKYDEDGNLLSANLDIKNPNSADALEHLPPDRLIGDILAKEAKIVQIVEEIKAELTRGTK